MMKMFQKNAITKKMNMTVAAYGVPELRLSRMLQNVVLVIIVLLKSVLRQLKVSFVRFISRPEPSPEPVELRSMV